jgi:hypothetical protein
MPKIKPDQEFLFQHAKIANETWDTMELEIIKKLRKSLNVNARNMQEFRHLVAKKKKIFMKEVKTLLKTTKKEFRLGIVKEIEKMAKKGLKITSSLVESIEQKAKNWQSQPVSSSKKFLKRSKYIFKGAEKIIIKDVELISSRILTRLSKTHNHIVQEIASNVGKLKNNELFVSQLREETLRSLGRVAKFGVPEIYTKSGNKMQLSNYAEMATRGNFKNAFNQMQTNRIKEYGIDLVISSYLADSSKICEPYQGNVFSVSGDQAGYPDKGYAEADGHTTHLFCRHIWMPYVHNISLKPPRVAKETINKNRDNRLKQRYNERQIRK